MNTQSELQLTRRLTLLSFGFKFGHPPCNYYFDASFLKNPARETKFGLFSEPTNDMIDFVRNQPPCLPFVEKIADLALFLVDLDNDIRIGIGCNAGRHRSRIVCRVIADAIDQRDGSRNIHVKLVHREEAFL